jgi:hypothetical protein
MPPIDLADPTMLPSAPDNPMNPDRPRLAPGTRVEVRRTLDDKWARGFEVVEATPDGYRLRRLSDGEEMPIAFMADVVRKEKKRDTWWY